MTAFEIVDRLVRQCGWTLDAYEDWVSTAVIAAIAVPPTPVLGTQTGAKERGNDAPS